MSSVSVCRVAEVTCSCAQLPAASLSSAAAASIRWAAAGQPGPAQPSLSSWWRAQLLAVTLGCTVDLITPAHEHHCDSPRTTATSGTTQATVSMAVTSARPRQPGPGHVEALTAEAG